MSGLPLSNARSVRYGVVLALTALVVSACGGQPPPSPTTSRPGITLPPTTTPPASQGKLKLGTLSASIDPGSCAGRPQCQIPFEVSCPNVRTPAQGKLVVLPAQGQPKGMIMMLLGGTGTGFYGVSRMFVRTLQADGQDVVILSWVDPWLQSAPGEAVGPKTLACRSATAIAWTHDHLYAPVHGASTANRTCGFCLQGNSGGASQIAYSLSFYGVASIVDAAVLSGGPPHAAIARGCLQEPGFGYSTMETGTIDLSYGFSANGPCAGGDQSYADKWERDSVESGGVYTFPNTRISFVFVQDDPTVGPAHGMVYLDKLDKAGTPFLSHTVIPGNRHTIESLPNGRETLEQELVGTGG